MQTNSKLMAMESSRWQNVLLIIELNLKLSSFFPKPLATLFSLKSSIDRVLKKSPDSIKLNRKITIKQIICQQSISTVDPNGL